MVLMTSCTEPGCPKEDGIPGLTAPHLGRPYRRDRSRIGSSQSVNLGLSTEAITIWFAARFSGSVFDSYELAPCRGTD